MKLNRSGLSWITMMIIAISVFALMAGSAFAKDEASRDNHPEPIIPLQAGDVPPDFTLTDMQGNEFSLSSFIGDRPVIIDFWATWCNPCRMEMPLLNEFTEMYGDQIEVIGLTSEAEESAQTITDFISENGYIIRYIHDPSGAVSTEYKVTGIPYLVVVGTDGLIINTHLGYTETIIDELTEDLGLE